LKDNPDPNLYWAITTTITQIPWFLIVVKTVLTVAFLYLSSFLSAFDAGLNHFLGNKKEPDSQWKKIHKQLPNVQSSLSIFQIILNTAAGILLADILCQLFNIHNTYQIYTLVSITIFATMVYGNALIFLVPRNKKIHENYWLLESFMLLSFILSPITKTYITLKKSIKNALKKKGYLPSEQKADQSAPYFNLAKAAADFNNTTIKQVMRSRLDITSFSIDLDFHELLSNLNKFGFSRVPIYRDTIDRIEGVLYIKDLLTYIGKDENFPWQNMLRPAYFVPENKKIGELLREFQEKHVHMALIVDGYGGISGLITLEDILEEIVGEINDELDEVDQNYIRLDENSYIFEAKTSLNDFCKIIGIEHNFFEEIKGERE
jgi:putative hemolysin